MKKCTITFYAALLSFLSSASAMDQAQLRNHYQELLDLEHGNNGEDAIIKAKHLLDISQANRAGEINCKVLLVCGKHYLKTNKIGAAVVIFKKLHDHWDVLEPVSQIYKARGRAYLADVSLGWQDNISQPQVAKQYCEHILSLSKDPWSLTYAQVLIARMMLHGEIKDSKFCSNVQQALQLLQNALNSNNEEAQAIAVFELALYSEKVSSTLSPAQIRSYLQQAAEQVVHPEIKRLACQKLGQDLVKERENSSSETAPSAAAACPEPQAENSDPEVKQNSSLSESDDKAID